MATAAGAGALSGSAGLSLSSIGSIAGGLGSIASAFGSGGSGKGQNAANQFRWQQEKDERFAQHAIRWRVNDAKAAGLHPLAAVGFAGAQSNSPSYAIPASNSPDFASMGQGIDRALNRGKNNLQKELDNLALEKAKLENDYIRTQIAGSQQQIAKSAGSPPLFSTPTSPRNSSSNVNRGVKSDIKPSVQLYRNFDGTVSAYPSQELSEALEAYGVMGQLHYADRNTLPFEIKHGGSWFGKTARWLKKEINRKPFYKRKKNYTKINWP